MAVNSELACPLGVERADNTAIKPRASNGVAGRAALLFANVLRALDAPPAR